jgi:REP element-mobilizing transposase RayT
MKNLRVINEQYPYMLYGYCLMGNHVHLQIATMENEIWKIMQGLHWRYSKYFNSKYGHVGHLFQDRYYSEIIETESYLLQTSKYIHLNPVKAGIVNSPIQYPWSSYGVFLGVKRNSLICEDNILMYFQDNSRELYKKYVESDDEQ